MKDLYRKAVWGWGPKLAELPPPATELRAVRLAGRLAAEGAEGKRAHIRGNLQRAFPDWDPNQLDGVAKAAFASHFSNQYISLSFPRCDQGTWTRYLRFENMERLEQAADHGKGVVLMHPHMGPAQLPLHVLGVLGWPMHQVGGGVVTLVDLSETGQWAAKTRGELEQVMPVTLHDGKGYLRPLLRALSAGDVVMSACDGTGGGQELGRRYVRTILGQQMPVPVGAVWMAIRSGAPLLTVRCRRNRGESLPVFVAEIGPEIQLKRDAPLRKALAHGADQVAAYLEDCLRSWPGDWLFWDGFEPGGLLVEEPSCTSTP